MVCQGWGASHLVVQPAALQPSRQVGEVDLEEVPEGDLGGPLTTSLLGTEAWYLGPGVGHAPGASGQGHPSHPESVDRLSPGLGL